MILTQKKDIQQRANIPTTTTTVTAALVIDTEHTGTGGKLTYFQLTLKSNVEMQGSQKSEHRKKGIQLRANTPTTIPTVSFALFSDTRYTGTTYLK